MKEKTLLPIPWKWKAQKRKTVNTMNSAMNKFDSLDEMD